MTVITHFSLRNLINTPTYDGFSVAAFTDVPCHLYCRITSQEPRIHKEASYRRGLWIADDVRFCFTVFEDIEQEEAGDTTEHHFIQEPWPVCYTKWFYLHGTIDALPCVSTSPYFALHREKQELPSQLLHPDGDGDLTQLLSTDEPHYLAVLYEDTVFIPPNGGYIWGRWDGHYVRKNWWPWGYRSDLYTFDDPAVCDNPITDLICYYRLCRDAYPYGKWKSHLRILGFDYYSDPRPAYYGFYLAEHSWPINPSSLAPWTQQEVADLQAGIAMDKVGSYGNLVCDLMYIELKY